MTLFRNPAEFQERAPGSQVRTRITCPEQEVDLEVTVRGDQARVSRCTVTCRVPSEEGTGTDEITFTLENNLPSAPGSGF